MKGLRRIGIAVAMSPNLAPFLAEAQRYAGTFGGETVLIHVGARTPHVEQQIESAWSTPGSPPLPPIIWRTGSPSDAIIDEIERNGIELIIAGANERETLLRGFYGSVARTLARDAPSSVLLITAPKTPPRPIRRISVNLDFDEMALVLLRRGLRLATALSSSEIDVIHVSPTFGEDYALADGVDERELRAIEAQDLQGARSLIDDYIDAAGVAPIPVRSTLLEGNRGQLLFEHARRNDVDLLIVPVVARTLLLERIFHSDLERLLRTIPCHLLLMRAGEQSGPEDSA